ncbi:MAG: CDP-2,3-bis-(O-geranylgeranyl)-sn-glycerol synthase [Candidatus Bathyarchaeota archaeon]|nr:CDP-2,3-bis-(O-geranylgeranyl)-sn-glycerol synthase [Candidatus Bathyarchaeota archaeon]
MAIIDVCYALWFIFPAYCANAMPVIFGGGRPIDFGKGFWDGKPILGSHKTLRGFFSGLVVGTLVGLFQTLFFQHVLFRYDTQFRYNILLGLMLSLGALVGDLAESFIKRRLNVSPGSSLPIADQLDFVIGAFLFSLPVSPPSLTTTLIILIITLPTHLLTNLLANLLDIRRKIRGK